MLYGTLITDDGKPQLTKKVIEFICITVLASKELSKLGRLGKLSINDPPAHHHARRILGFPSSGVHGRLSRLFEGNVLPNMPEHMGQAHYRRPPHLLP